MLEVLILLLMVGAIGLLRLRKFLTKTIKLFEPPFISYYKIKAQTNAVIRGQIRSLPKVRVTYVNDGDTIIVSKAWHKITIRLDSIDCPEDGQYWGDIAKYGLMKLIGGKYVYLEEHGLDSHGRTLATIYIRHKNKEEWLNVNERMVILGHAWVMRMFYDHLPEDRQEKLNRLEAWARSKKVGLWNESNPMPPWEWRNRQKGAKDWLR